MVVGEQPPLVLAPLGREVRHHDLPGGNGHPQKLVEPRGLRLPEPHEPTDAIIDVQWPSHSTTRVRWVVLPGADVVRVVLFGVEGVEDVGVHEEVVHAKAVVPHLLRPIQCRREPAPSACTTFCPGVGDRLVPTGSECVAAVVVVPKHPEPLLRVKPVAAVDSLEEALPLAGPIAAPSHRLPAVADDAAPVHVVSHIEDVVGSAPLGPQHHLLRNAELRDIVRAVDKRPVVVEVL
mmetsp:Transcript_81260/g.215672  ORF Transcript_81260/g.215672 Transcript_81260/m.215672 type:complete len:235 (-) Transcript_81260:193-897(-)